MDRHLMPEDADMRVSWQMTVQRSWRVRQLKKPWCRTDCVWAVSGHFEKLRDGRITGSVYSGILCRPDYK